MSESDAELLKKSELLENLDEETFNKVVSRISEVEFPAGSVYIKEGDRADALYIIKEGVSQVFTYDDAKSEIILARLENGNYVGEQALLTTSPGLRNASVRALTDISLLKINHSDFREVLEFDEVLKGKLEKIGCQQLLEKLKTLGTRHNLALYLFDDPQKYEIKEFKTDDFIISEGERSKGIYYILSGFVDIYKKDKEGKEDFICTISPGNVFGERGAIWNQPALMTVKAQGPLKTSFIQAKRFKELYASNTEIQEIIDTMQRFFQFPNRGQITQYKGNFMGMPAIISQFQMKDGRKITAASVLEKNIRSISQLSSEEASTYTYEEDNVYRELQIENERIISVTCFGEWEHLDTIYAKVFDRSPITDDQIQHFKEHGDLPINFEVIEPNKEIICNCIYTNRGIITSCIRDGCSTVEEISKNTGAGAVCGSCIPTIEAMLGHSSWQPVKISEMIPLTEDVRAYRLVSTRDEPLKDFVAGQHIVIQCNIDENWVERCYTLTSPPGDPMYYEIAVKREELGLFSRWIFDHDKTLPLLRVSRPHGTFTLDTSKTSPIVCFMAGVGITPALCFSRTFIKYNIQRPLNIFYTVSNETKMVYKEELTSLAEKHDSIKLFKHLTSDKGRMQEGDIIKIMEELPTAVYFICGPKSYREMVMKFLIKGGIDVDRILVEVFTHAGGPSS